MNRDYPETQHIYFKKNSLPVDETNPKFQDDLEKIVFFASQFIDANKKKNECFATLKALNSRFSDFQNQIISVANTLPTLTDDQKEFMTKEEMSMLKEMRSIQDKLRFERNEICIKFKSYL